MVHVTHKFVSIDGRLIFKFFINIDSLHRIMNFLRIDWTHYYQISTTWNLCETSICLYFDILIFFKFLWIPVLTQSIFFCFRLKFWFSKLQSGVLFQAALGFILNFRWILIFTDTASNWWNALFDMSKRYDTRSI